MAHRTLFASSRPTVAVASFVVGLTVALSALALMSRHVRLVSAYNTARTQVPVVDSASLERFLACVRPGFTEADRPYWCAATDRCVLRGGAGLDGDDARCPETSPRCRLPLISPGDRLFDPVGITNQKMNVRDAAAIARAVGGALLVTQVATRAEALWDPSPLRGLNVSWTHVPFGAAFDADHFLRAARASVCAFYEPDDSALEGVATELVRVDSPPGRRAAWFRAEAERWRSRGATLVVLQNPWAAFRPPPVPGAVDSLSNPRPRGRVVAWTPPGPTPDAAPADPDDAAFARIYADWPLWFLPPPDVRRVVAAALASAALGEGGIAQQQQQQQPFWALHLRAEKDWPYHVPEPAIILQELLRCQPPPGQRLVIAGGFMTPADEARAAPYIELICNASALARFECVNLTAALRALPPLFASSFDLRALAEAEVLAAPACARLWGARDSTFTVALAMRRRAEARLPTAFYDRRRPGGGWSALSPPVDDPGPAAQVGPCAEVSGPLAHAAFTVVHLF